MLHIENADFQKIKNEHGIIKQNRPGINLSAFFFFGGQQ